jgi:hypothetical protein
LHFSELEPKTKLYQHDQLVQFSEPEPKKKKRTRQWRDFRNLRERLQDRTQSEIQEKSNGGGLFTFFHHHFVQTPVPTLLDSLFFLLFWAGVAYFINAQAIMAFTLAVAGASFAAYGSWAIYSVVKALVCWGFGIRKGNADEALTSYYLILDQPPNHPLRARLSSRSVA